MNKKAITKDPAHRAEVEATVQALPLEPPANTIPTLIERGRGGKDALIYRAGRFNFPGEVPKREAVRVTCTACGGSVIMEKVRGESCRGTTHIGYGAPGTPFIDNRFDGELDYCRLCGRQDLQAIHVSRFGKERNIGLDGSWALTVHNVRGHLCLLQWVVEKRADKEGKTSYRIYRKEGTLVIDGVCVRVCGFLTTYYRNVVELDGWISREVYKARYANWSAGEIIPFDNREVWESDSANCAIERYFDDLAVTGETDRILPEAYIRLWTRFPHVENLVRSGHSEILNRILAACVVTTTNYYYADTVSFNMQKTRDYIDWKKKRPHEMFRVEKPELRTIDTKTALELEIRNWMKNHDIKPTEDLIGNAAGVGWPEARDLITDGFFGIKPKPVRLINYLAHQKSAQARSPRFLCDYWRMVHEYQGEIPRELVWPKYLKRAHDDIMQKIQQKKDAELQRKIAETFELRKKLAWEDPVTGLMIRPAKNQDELIEEGKQLHHCVAGYATNVARGLTTILFIRKIEAPDVPFFTLEYNNGCVVQNRGNGNCCRTPEVATFEARWLEHLAALNNKKTKKERVSVNG